MARGFCDKDLTWALENFTLKISGKSRILNCILEEAPWHLYPNTIKNLVIECGVTSIGEGAFSGCESLTSVTIPDSVKTIGDCAFTVCYCGNATNRKNVFWSLDDGTLSIKKNSVERNASDFSIGYETWQVVEKNIKRIELERGGVPGKQFFDWINRLSSEVPVTF